MKLLYTSPDKTVKCYHFPNYRVDNNEADSLIIIIINNITYSLSRKEYYEFMNNERLMKHLWQALPASEYKKLQNKIYKEVGL